jgi:ATP-dependent RNA helicase DHX36
VVFGAETSDLKKRFLLFHEKVKTTKVYLRDATLVGAYPLLLFGGKVEVDHAQRQGELRRVDQIPRRAARGCAV